MPNPAENFFKKLKKIWPALVFALVIFQLGMTAALPARADLLSDQAGLDEIGTKAFGSTGEPTDIRVIVANVIRVFLGLLGIIFLFLLVLGGYKWMTAMGDASKVDEAKQQLQTAVIGLVIILAAYSITVFVVNCAVRAVNNDTAFWYCPN